MNDNKLKHLEFIQNVITRMNSNSFLIKGWAVTLISALFALSAKDANLRYVMISYIVIPTFWVLDGFFLSQERQYRNLYRDIRQVMPQDIDFKMDAKEYDIGRNTWLNSIFSGTLGIFYGICIVTTLLVMFLL